MSTGESPGRKESLHAEEEAAATLLLQRRFSVESEFLLS